MPWTVLVIAAETGDFDGNGMRDISTDALAIWLLNGLQVVQSGSPATVPTNWQIVGIGDVDGDGRADILWRDGGTGTLAIWRMNGPVDDGRLPGVLGRLGKPRDAGV